MIIKVVKTDAAAEIPYYQTGGAAGVDLSAIEEVIIYPGKTVKVRTGLSFEIPDGFEAQVRPRSGMTLKTKLRVQIGTIDSDYRGEVSVIVDNIGEEVKRIGIGERIAQLVISPIVQARFVEVEELTDTDRGAGGFGSTGTLNVRKTELEQLKNLISEVMG